ncbi:MAG: winged helix-turn-helix domain-containing protein [Chloroflexota bacterium]|nr:winged helix-turn-helix domain-containing protein [Chloroflexota bacterium]
MSSVALPSVRDLYVPVMLAIRKHGGESDNDAIADEVVDLLDITEEQLAVTYNPPRDRESKVLSRLIWARSHLKIAGYLYSPRRTVWKMTEKARRIQHFDRDELIQAVVEARAKRGY